MLIISIIEAIDPIEDAWLQFQICYYIFSLVFIVFDVFQWKRVRMRNMRHLDFFVTL